MIDEWRKPPPSGLVTAEQHERAFLQLAELLEKQIAGLLAPGKDGAVAPMLVSRAKELSLAAIRARKCASDLALERERNEHVDWLAALERELKSGGRHRVARPPLQFVPPPKDGAA